MSITRLGVSGAMSIRALLGVDGQPRNLSIAATMSEGNPTTPSGGGHCPSLKGPTVSAYLLVSMANGGEKLNSVELPHPCRIV